VKRDEAVRDLKKVFDHHERLLDVQIDSLPLRAEARVRLAALRKEVMAVIGTTTMMKAQGRIYAELRYSTRETAPETPAAL
jgi:hypothetical protein